jgi:predicted MFS family arabinose efflux permease
VLYVGVTCYVSEAYHVLMCTAGGLAGWRVAMLVVGCPGVIIALLILRIQEPPLGAAVGHHVRTHMRVLHYCIALLTLNYGCIRRQESSEKDDGPKATMLEALLELPRNPYYMCSQFAQVFIAFESGGPADWFPVYLERKAGASTSTAGLVIGGVTVVGGLGGVALGAILGERIKGRTKNPHFFLSGVGLVRCPSAAFLVS